MSSGRGRELNLRSTIFSILSRFSLTVPQVEAANAVLPPSPLPAVELISAVPLDSGDDVDSPLGVGFVHSESQVESLQAYLKPLEQMATACVAAIEQWEVLLTDKQIGMQAIAKPQKATILDAIRGGFSEIIENLEYIVSHSVRATEYKSALRMADQELQRRWDELYVMSSELMQDGLGDEARLRKQMQICEQCIGILEGQQQMIASIVSAIHDSQERTRRSSPHEALSAAAIRVLSSPRRFPLPGDEFKLTLPMRQVKALAVMAHLDEANKERLDKVPEGKVHRALQSGERAALEREAYMQFSTFGRERSRAFMETQTDSPVLSRPRSYSIS